MAETIRATTDHEEIRQWVEKHGGRPAITKKTGIGEDDGVLMLEFPDEETGKELQEISWEDFFDKFEEDNLALLYKDMEDETGRHFHQLVRRDEYEDGDPLAAEEALDDDERKWLVNDDEEPFFK